jgi:hypothetical protein
LHPRNLVFTIRRSPAEGNSGELDRIIAKLDYLGASLQLPLRYLRRAAVERTEGVVFSVGEAEGKELFERVAAQAWTKAEQRL